MKYSLIFVCQKGELEIQSMVLAASLFENMNCNCELVAALPTPVEYWGEPNTETKSFLKNLGVRFMYIENKIGSDYPIGNKISCLDLPLSGDVTVFFDSDIVCLKPFDFCQAFTAQFCAKPADGATFTKTDSVWEYVYSSFGLQAPKEKVQATYSKEQMLPYFNAGFIAVQYGTGLGKEWARICKTIDQRLDIPNKRPWLDQIGLPIAVASLGLKYKCLDESYNYPSQMKIMDPDCLPIFSHYHESRYVLKDKILLQHIRQLAFRHLPIYKAMKVDPFWRFLFYKRYM